MQAFAIISKFYANNLRNLYKKYIFSTLKYNFYGFPLLFFLDFFFDKAYKGTHMDQLTITEQNLVHNADD